MANYNVDIAVALKGAEKLGRFNKQIKDVADNIKGANIFLQSFSKGSEGLARSVNNLQTNLNLANKNLKSAALGTKEATIAAYQFLKAQEQINKGLREEALLLKEVEKNMRFSRLARGGIRETSNQYSGPIGPGQASNILGGQSLPVEGKIQRTLDLRRDEIKLQEALYALELKSAATLNEKLQIQGELNRQTAQAVNDIKLRGQFSPLTSDVRGNIYDVKSRIEKNTLASRRAKFRNVFSGVSGRDFGQLGGRIGPVEPIRSEGGFLAFSRAATKIEAGVKHISKSSAQTARVLSSQAASAAFQDLPFGVKGGQIGPRQSLFNRLGFGRNASPRGPFAMQGGRSARIRTSLQSGLIGGGFPLLFGGGGASAAAGGLGGLAGGALSAGGGFALSIAATAAVSKIQEVRNFRKSIKDLNEDLEALGAKSLFSRQEIKQLGKDLDITGEEAVELVTQFKKFEGELGTKLSQIFGSREIFDATVGLNDFESVLARIKTLSEELTLEKEFEAYSILSKDGAEAANDFITNLFIADRQRKLFRDRFVDDIKSFNKVGFNWLTPDDDAASMWTGGEMVSREFIKTIRSIMDTNAEIQKIMNDSNYLLSRGGVNQAGIDKINDILKEILSNEDKLSEALLLLPEDFEFSTAGVKDLTDALGETIEKLQFLQEFKAPQAELRNLLNPLRQILDLSTEIKLGFEDAFKGIIKGTMSVGDAFRSMLNRIADYFLDYAARTAALGLQNLFLSPFKDRFAVDTSIFDRPGVKELLDGERANGGNVIGGKSYLVGERGPELFTPGATGTITANNAIGGASIVVNVDASGTSVEGNEANGEELGRLIGAVVQSELIKEKRPGGLLS